MIVTLSPCLIMPAGSIVSSVVLVCKDRMDDRLKPASERKNIFQ